MHLFDIFSEGGPEDQAKQLSLLIDRIRTAKFPQSPPNSSSGPKASEVQDAELVCEHGGKRKHMRKFYIISKNVFLEYDMAGYLNKPEGKNFFFLFIKIKYCAVRKALHVSPDAHKWSTCGLKEFKKNFLNFISVALATTKRNTVHLI